MRTPGQRWLAAGAPWRERGVTDVGWDTEADALVAAAEGVR